MEKGRRMDRALAIAALLAGASLVEATTPVVLDNFNATEGHFNQAPGFSGSNRNLDGAASTADRVTTDGPMEGLGHEKLVLKVTSGPAWTSPPGEGVFYCRFLSGGGAPASNVAFTTSSDTDGWIGFFAKTTQANMEVQIWIEGGSPTVNNNSAPKALINDGQWHLYEWNLDDTSGGPDGWVATPGILTGDPTVRDSSHTIDSIIIRGKSGFALGQVCDPIYIDFVAINPSGSLADLVAQQCRNVPDVAGVSGPVQAGDTSVVVNGCSTALKTANGDAVYVYADNVKIGELTSGFNTTTGTNTVPLFTTPTQVTLAKGQRLTATQKLNGQEGCLPDPSTGVIVGGGNSAVRLTLCVRDKPGLVGPLGADGGTGGKLVWVGTDTSLGGSPQGPAFSPSPCWQTVEFHPLTDPRLNFAGTGDGTATLPDLPWGEIEHLAVSMNPDAVNTGPYTIYIDDVENGSEGILTGFESGESQVVNLNQVNVLFSTPSFSGTTSNSLLALPNTSIVTDEQSYNGSRSLKLSWQFSSESPSAWVRLTAATNNNHAYQNPMIRLDQPVKLRILMLPAGGTAATAPEITAQPANVTDKCPGQSVSFSVVVTGSNLTYQWSKSTDGGATYSDIGGANGATYTFTAAAEDSGTVYRCLVTDTVSGCTVLSYPAKYDSTPRITQQPLPVMVCAGGSASFTVAATGAGLTYRWKENGTPLNNGNGISGATDPTLVINPVNASRTGNLYTVDVTGCGTLVATSVAASLDVSNEPQAPPVVTPASVVALGTAVTIRANAGFAARYWNSGGAAAPPWPDGAAPALIRLDPVVDFAWGDGTLGTPGTPDIAVNLDHFITRWQAKVVAPSTGDYTFYTKTDDGARLYVDGALIIDHWVDQGGTEWCGPGATAPGTCTPVALTAGQVVDLRMEFYENAGAATAQLSWAGPDLPKQIVNPAPGQWTRNGVVVPGATSGLLSIPAMGTANAGTYRFTYTDACSGAVVVSAPVDLDVPADFNGDHVVNVDDVYLFASCVTGPAVPYTAAAPCTAEMDMDGDGDVDLADYGRMQRQFATTP